MYQVKWTDCDGHKQARGFAHRHSAILFLNHLILDCGYADARIRKGR